MLLICPVSRYSHSWRVGIFWELPLGRLQTALSDLPCETTKKHHSPRERSHRGIWSGSGASGLFPEHPYYPSVLYACPSGSSSVDF